MERYQYVEVLLYLSKSTYNAVKTVNNNISFINIIEVFFTNIIGIFYRWTISKFADAIIGRFKDSTDVSNSNAFWDLISFRFLI